ncbi:MAG: hypothetical protein ACE5K9_07445 [Candidatus Methylomirabilales bacterium]
MKYRLSKMARTGTIALLCLLVSQAALAADFLFFVPVQIRNPDPSWERASVTCVVTGKGRRNRVAAGTIYLDLSDQQNLNANHYVPANLIPGASIGDAKQWSCHIRIKPKGSPGYPPMSRTEHNAGRSRTVVTGRFQ